MIEVIGAVVLSAAAYLSMGYMLAAPLHHRRAASWGAVHTGYYWLLTYAVWPLVVSVYVMDALSAQAKRAHAALRSEWHA